jgi:hypothetical protein
LTTRVTESASLVPKNFKGRAKRGLFYFNPNLNLVLNPKIGLGEHTRLGCCWTRLASSLFARQACLKVRNFSMRSRFSARARALPISTSVFGLNRNHQMKQIMMTIKIKI